MNYKNFDIEKELADRDVEKDWRFGAFSQPCLYEIPVELQEAYLPQGEIQRGTEDFNDCAGRGPINKLAGKFTYADQNGIMKPENRSWGRKVGFATQNGVWDFSDRYTAILSGTTKQGNSLKAPIEAIRKHGLIPKSMLPAEKWMNFTAYTDPASITEEMREIGQEFTRRFTINYENVPNSLFPTFKEMLVTAVYAWPFPDDNGVYQKDDRPFNHVCVKFSDFVYKIFDNYLDRGVAGDYIKVLAPNYRFFDYGYRIYVSAENVPSNKPDLFSIALLWISKIITWMMTGKKGTMPVMPKELEPSDANVPIDGPKPKQETLGERIAEFTESMIGRDASPHNKAPQDVACAETISYLLHHEIPDFPEGIVGTIELNKALASSSHFKRTLEPFPGCVTVYPSIMVNGVITKHGHAFIYITNDKMCSNDSATGLLKQNYTRQKAIHYYHDILGLKGYIYAPVD